MRLAVFSPVSPQRSAIADYTEELLPHLRRHATVDVWVDNVVPTHESVTAHRWFDYGKDPALLGQLGSYDGVVCHMGNDGRWHGGIYDVIVRVPSVVVLHDLALSHFFHSLSILRQQNWIYLTEVERQDGRAARRAVELDMANDRPLPHEEDALRLPMIRGLVEKAAGVIVHAGWAKERVDALEIDVPVRHIPPAMAARATPALGSGGAPLRIGTFGLVTPDKGVERTLRVLRSLVGGLDVEYWVVGDPHPSVDVTALARSHGLEDRVQVTGHLSMAEFRWRVEQVDVAMNLRERTAGETSNSLLRLMAAGIPTVVTEIGAFADLPDDCVAKVPQGPHEDQLLRATLLELGRRPELRRRLGRAGWEHVRRHHDPDRVAADHVRFVEQVMQRRSRRLVTTAVARSLPVADADFEAIVADLADDLVPAGEAVFVADEATAPVRAGRTTPPAMDRPPTGASAPVDVEGYRHVVDAADVATLLRLPLGSRILDAACGSGWLTEHLARFGYRVTGADVSPELVELAAARLAALPHEVSPGRSLDARLVVHDLEGPPLPDTFDAVVIYDALHHLGDEGAAVAHLAAMVAPGGLLYIVAGDRPVPGSQGEAELLAAMERSHTLESPFDHTYLVGLVEATGLVVIGDDVAVDGYRRLLAKQTIAPARGTSAGGRDGLRAQWSLGGAPPASGDRGSLLTLAARVTNAGDRVWLADRPDRAGAVSVVSRVGDGPLSWTPLPRALGPREQLDLDLAVTLPDQAGPCLVTVDLVAEQLGWFSEAGSEVLRVELEVT